MTDDALSQIEAQFRLADAAGKAPTYGDLAEIVRAAREASTTACRPGTKGLCDACKGTGINASEPCGKCEGTGLHYDDPPEPPEQDPDA